MNRVEPEHLHLEIPDAWSQIQRVMTRFVGESRNLGIALNGGDGCAGQKLVGGPDGPAVLGCRE